MIFRLLLSTIFFLSCNPSVAQVKVIEGQYGLNTQMPTNYVRNKGCFTNVANITASGGSLTRNTTTPLENGADCQVDASASAQTYTWATFALDRWLSGQNCEAKFNYRGDASLYKAYVTVNSVKVSTDLQLQNSSSPSVQPVSINFPCGAQPLTTALVIESTSVSAAAINVAGVYVGAATNIGTVAQAKNVVQFTWSGTLTANHDQDILFTWSGATQTRLENLSHSSGVFTVLVPGDYQTKFCPRLDYNAGSASTMRAITAKVYKNSTSTPLDASGYVHGLAQNNINGGGEPSSGFYANPPPCVVTTMSLATNDTLRFKAYQANGAGSNFSWLGGTLEINYFPSSSQQVIRPNITTSFYQGAHDGTCTWTLTSTTFTNYTADASCALVDGPKSNITAAIVGSTRPGLALNLPEVGPYYICARGSFYGSVSTGHAHRLWDGSTVIATGSDTSSTEADSISLCGIYTATSLTPTIEIQSNAGSGSNTLAAQRTGANAVEWTVLKVSQNLAAPIIIGSVTSNSSSALRTESAYLTNAGSCAVSTQTSSWITSVSDPGVGQCGLVWSASTWSAAPWCQMTSSGGGVFTVFLFPVTTTGVTTLSTSPAGGGTSTDSGFYITCTGPR